MAAGDIVTDDSGDEREVADVNVIGDEVVLFDSQGEAIIAGVEKQMTTRSRITKPDVSVAASPIPPGSRWRSCRSSTRRRRWTGSRVLDRSPAAGRSTNWRTSTVGVEIEPEWATLHADTVIGSALDLRFDDESFDAVCTSPCYGNRLADSHDAADGSLRRSYTHDLGHKLHADNAGALQWGKRYRGVHTQAWEEAWRVLEPRRPARAQRQGPRPPTHPPARDGLARHRAHAPRVRPRVVRPARHRRPAPGREPRPLSRADHRLRQASRQRATLNLVGGPRVVPRPGRRDDDGPMCPSFTPDRFLAHLCTRPASERDGWLYVIRDDWLLALVQRPPTVDVLAAILYGMRPDAIAAVTETTTEAVPGLIVVPGTVVRLDWITPTGADAVVRGYVTGDDGEREWLSIAEARPCLDHEIIMAVAARVGADDQPGPRDAARQRSLDETVAATLGLRLNDWPTRGAWEADAAAQADAEVDAAWRERVGNVGDDGARPHPR